MLTLLLATWPIGAAAASIAADRPQMSAVELQSANQELREKLQAAEERIKELERLLEASGRRVAPRASLSTGSPDVQRPTDPAVTSPPAPGPLAQGAGIPPRIPEQTEQPKYEIIEKLEEKLPPWFPKFLGAQWNVINQRQFPFHSPYSGLNSLNQGGEDKTSQTRSVYIGSQVTDNLQAYVDLEWFVGNGVHGGTGLGGYVNGDVVRAGPANLPKDPYLARAYGRYILPLSGDTVQVLRGQDQLPGHEPTQYLFAKAGHLAVTDDFDTNRYANSVRTQFMNYALINNGAFDFAADTRGYSNGATFGWVNPSWSFKIGSFQVPKVANGEQLDFQLGRAQGSEAELSIKPFGDGAVIRLLTFANQARMGRYRTAIQTAQASGSTPSVAADDHPGRWKYGFGLNAEIPLADGGDTGLFFRAGWNDGKTETWAFTEIDRSLSFGGQLDAGYWGRDDDWVGVGVAINGLSSAHKDYLALGGTGFMIGDGRLRYAPETIVESYYNLKLNEYLRLSPDYQYIRNPAYNADRGPVHVVSARARAAF